jgi:hypothetical protein
MSARRDIPIWTLGEEDWYPNRQERMLAFEVTMTEDDVRNTDTDLSDSLTEPILWLAGAVVVAPVILFATLGWLDKEYESYPFDLAFLVVTGAGLRAAWLGLKVARERVALGRSGVAGYLVVAAGALYFLVGSWLAFVLEVTSRTGSPGRAPRHRGKFVLAPLARGAGWSSREMPLATRSEDAFALASHWRENGRGEHASVAAFARLTLDLLAVGAPARLLQQTQRAGLDEVAHAELCFSIARSIDDGDVSPGVFRAAAAGAPSRFRWLALARLAVGSLVEGALFEGHAATVLRRLAGIVEDPSIAGVLGRMADDEARHAALAWDVLEWCLAEGGFSVTWVVRGAARRLPECPGSSVPAAARDGAWIRHGIPSCALEASAYADVRDSVRSRTRTLVETLTWE